MKAIEGVADRLRAGKEDMDKDELAALVATLLRRLENFEDAPEPAPFKMTLEKRINGYGNVSPKWSVVAENNCNNILFMMRELRHYDLAFRITQEGTTICFVRKRTDIAMHSALRQFAGQIKYAFDTYS